MLGIVGPGVGSNHAEMVGTFEVRSNPVGKGGLVGSAGDPEVLVMGPLVCADVAEYQPRQLVSDLETSW
jgi:hypothetical protein